MSFGDVLLTGLMLVSLFLMFVILLQRGRGGGLAGAFGGLGGQSAFGTKAGDVFTVITVVTVIIWVILACVAGARLRYENSVEYRFQNNVVAPAAPAPDEGGKKKGEPDDTGKDETAPAEETGTGPGKDKPVKTSSDTTKTGAGEPQETGGKSSPDSGTGSKNPNPEKKPE